MKCAQEKNSLKKIQKSSQPILKIEEKSLISSFILQMRQFVYLWNMLLVSLKNPIRMKTVMKLVIEDFYVALLRSLSAY